MLLMGDTRDHANLQEFDTCAYLSMLRQITHEFKYIMDVCRFYRSQVYLFLHISHNNLIFVAFPLHVSRVHYFARRAHFAPVRFGLPVQPLAEGL